MYIFLVLSAVAVAAASMTVFVARLSYPRSDKVRIFSATLFILFDLLVVAESMNLWTALSDPGFRPYLVGALLVAAATAAFAVWIGLQLRKRRNRPI